MDLSSVAKPIFSIPVVDDVAFAGVTDSLVCTISGQVEYNDALEAVDLWQRFLDVIASLHVTVVGTTKHDFPGGGFTGLVMLAESHAAIHVWPEKCIAWVELATCGDPRDCNVFAQKVVAMCDRRDT